MSWVTLLFFVRIKVWEVGIGVILLGVSIIKSDMIQDENRIWTQCLSELRTEILGLKLFNIQSDLIGLDSWRYLEQLSS